jgi:hypothetical protein
MPSRNHTSSEELAPRVAKLETGLEILTRDVSTLASIVREQSGNIEQEIQKLAVGVTQAAAPKKTDWSTLIALAMLIMALGSAVFWPLNETAADNKSNIQKLELRLEDHNKDAVTKAQLERELTQISERVKELEANERERNKADLQELKELRGKMLMIPIGAK